MVIKIIYVINICFKLRFVCLINAVRGYSIGFRFYFLERINVTVERNIVQLPAIYVLFKLGSNKPVHSERYKDITVSDKILIEKSIELIPVLGEVERFITAIYPADIVVVLCDDAEVLGEELVFLVRYAGFGDLLVPVFGITNTGAAGSALCLKAEEQIVGEIGNEIVDIFDLVPVH